MSIEHQIRNKEKLDLDGNITLSHYIMFFFPFTAIKSEC